MQKIVKVIWRVLYFIALWTFFCHYINYTQRKWQRVNIMYYIVNKKGFQTQPEFGKCVSERDKER